MHLNRIKYNQIGSSRPMNYRFYLSGGGDQIVADQTVRHNKRSNLHVGPIIPLSSSLPKIVAEQQHKNHGRNTIQERSRQIYCQLSTPSAQRLKWLLCGVSWLAGSGILIIVQRVSSRLPPPWNDESAPKFCDSSPDRSRLKQDSLLEWLLRNNNMCRQKTLTRCRRQVWSRRCC